jgi:rubrerythrin
MMGRDKNPRKEDIVEFKDSRTYQNLVNSFAGESQARSRYSFYAEVAQKEGLLHAAAVFTETADNELAHAKVFYDHVVKRLGALNIHVNADYPASVGSTWENLEAAAAGEHEEFSLLYKNGAEVAREEGFEDIAVSFTEIAEVEERHFARYKALAAVVKDGKYFKREHKVFWKCRNCGYIHEGTEAPQVCPACKHAQKYFEVTSFEQ